MNLNENLSLIAIQGPDAKKVLEKVIPGSIALKFMNGQNFYQQVRVTADGRWFDNGGMPIEAPTKVEDEEEQESVGFMHRELTDEEKAEQAKWKTQQEMERLKKLK